MPSSEISCNPLDARDAEWMVPSPVSPPWLIVVMVSRDHAPFGSTAAFFRESMRRDAMTGTKIVFILSVTS